MMDVGRGAIATQLPSVVGGMPFVYRNMVTQKESKAFMPRILNLQFNSVPSGTVQRGSLTLRYDCCHVLIKLIVLESAGLYLSCIPLNTSGNDFPNSICSVLFCHYSVARNLSRRAEWPRQMV